MSFTVMQRTTPWEEHQVTREEAGGGSYRPPVQQVDHVSHRVARSEQSLKVHAAKCYWFPVGERADDKDRTSTTTGRWCVLLAV